MNQEKPTVFVLSNMREFGGAERSIATLLPHLVQEVRIRIYVINQEHQRDLERLQLPAMEIVRLPDGNSPGAMLQSLLKVRRDIIRERPRAVLTNGHKGALLLALLRWVLFGRSFQKVIYVRDFDYFTLPFILRSLPDALFAAPTQSVFDDLRYRRWGLAKRRCEVIPNAVVAPEIFAASATPEPFFACCARITPWKGIEYLIRAMASVAPRFPAARLRIYGEVVDAEYFAVLTGLIRELGLNEAISFEPFTANIGRVYNDGSFFVIPSLSISPGPESFCRIIIEAWSYAKPVIAFAVGGPKTLIRDGEDGFLVPERDVDALSARICELLAQPERCQQLGAAGADRVRTEFSPATIAARVADRLLRGPVPHPSQPAQGSASPVAA